MFSTRLNLTNPGLFITGTDTGVGKTVVSCAIAASMRRHGLRVGVSKPIASGCRREREGLVNDDAEALAHFANSPQPLDVINPVRYATPVAPAVAAEMQNTPVNVESMARSLHRLDQDSDVLVVEGVGGILVPLDATHTVIDLARWIGYPVVIVARAVLGTLNHTAMTAAILRQAGLPIAGVVINGYDVDVAKHDDPSVATNRRWIETMTGLTVLATLPRGEPGEPVGVVGGVCDGDGNDGDGDGGVVGGWTSGMRGKRGGGTAPQQGMIASSILDAADSFYWPDVLATSIGAVPPSDNV